MPRRDGAFSSDNQSVAPARSFDPNPPRPGSTHESDHLPDGCQTPITGNMERYRDPLGDAPAKYR